MQVELGKELFIPVVITGFSSSGETIQLKTKDGKIMLFCNMSELESLCIDVGCNVEEVQPNKEDKYLEYLGLKKDTRLLLKATGCVYFLNTIDENGAILTCSHSSEEPLAGVGITLEDLHKDYVVLKFENNDIITNGSDFFRVLHFFGESYYIVKDTLLEVITINYKDLHNTFNVFKVPEIGSFLVNRDTRKGFRVDNFYFNCVMLNSKGNDCCVSTGSLYNLFYTPKFKAGDIVELYLTGFSYCVLQCNEDGYILKSKDGSTLKVNFSSEEQFILKP